MGEITVSKFILKVLWLESNIAIAVDQQVGKITSPVTVYFFWPRTDAWDQLKVELKSKPWITEVDQIALLNQATEIINYWQAEKQKIPLNDLQALYPDIMFSGSY